MLIDVHAHFLHDRTPRADWRERNASRLRAGERVGITVHVASILGSWGATSPIYFPVACRPALRQRLPARAPARAPRPASAATSPSIRTTPTTSLAEIGALPRRGHDRDQARRQPPRRRSAARSHLPPRRRARGPRPAPHLAAPPARLSRAGGVRRASSWASWPRGTRGVPFLLAHIGGGGDWLHSLPVVRALPNVYVDLSGSGVDGGMLEACLEAVGVERLLWGCDLTIETGWAKLRYLEHLLSPAELELRPLAQRRARSFPPARFPPTDAHRRQRLRRRLSVPARARAPRPRRVLAAMDRVGIDRGLGHPPARRLLARPDRGQRLALRAHPRAARASARCRRCIPGSPAGATRCARPRTRGAPAVRCDPTFYGIDPAGPAMRALAAACGEADVALIARGAVRGRPPAAPQRPRSRAAGRRGARADPERSRAFGCSSPTPTGPFIEEVHFGSTPEEAAADLVGHLLDLGSAGGPPGDAARHGRRRPLRPRHRPAAADAGERGRQARPAGPRVRATGRPSRAGTPARSAEPVEIKAGCVTASSLVNGSSGA